MSHSCLAHWGADAEKLTKLLDKQTLTERKAAVGRFLALPKKEQRKRKVRTYQGWVHRADREDDYDELVKLYFELCLALKQPTDMPSGHGTTPLRPKLGSVQSKQFGNLAQAVRDGLKKDGAEPGPGGKLPFHSEHGIPRYGMGNWLEKPANLRRNMKESPLPVARALLRALRAAMDR